MRLPVNGLSSRARPLHLRTTTASRPEPRGAVPTQPASEFAAARPAEVRVAALRRRPRLRATRPSFGGRLRASPWRRVAACHVTLARGSVDASPGGSSGSLVCRFPFVLPHAGADIALSSSHRGVGSRDTSRPRAHLPAARGGPVAPAVGAILPVCEVMPVVLRAVQWRPRGGQGGRGAVWGVGAAGQWSSKGCFLRSRRRTRLVEGGELRDRESAAGSA